jgi:hypothetical protein
MVLTEDSFVELGLSLHNFRYSVAQQQRETQFTKFRRLYGINPKSCLDAFKAIQTCNNPERIDPKKACPYDFLLTLEWLRKYKDELDLAGLYGLSESTVSKVIWRYTRAIQGLKSRKIVWMEQWSNANSEIVIVSVMVFIARYVSHADTELEVVQPQDAWASTWLRDCCRHSSQQSRAHKWSISCWRA